MIVKDSLDGEALVAQPHLKYTSAITKNIIEFDYPVIFFKNSLTLPNFFLQRTTLEK
jgi:hypothetical protein